MCPHHQREGKTRQLVGGEKLQEGLEVHPRRAGTSGRLGPLPTLTELPEQDGGHHGSRQDGPQGDRDAQRFLGLWGKRGAHNGVAEFLRSYTLKFYPHYF